MAALARILDIGPGGYHMDGWGMAGWWFPTLFLVLIVALAAWFIWGGTRRGGQHRPAGNRALEVLGERYARGEIDREEYRQRKADLEG